MKKLELEVINKLKEKNAFGMYFDPQVFDNYIYWDKRYSDYEEFELLRIYENENNVIMCDYGLIGSYDVCHETDEFNGLFHTYELEQILEFIDCELQDNVVAEELEYQKNNPNYWLEDTYET